MKTIDVADATDTLSDYAKKGLMGQSEVIIKREGWRVVLEGARRTFSRRFLALAGSAADFPYPKDPPAVEPCPKRG